MSEKYKSIKVTGLLLTIILACLYSKSRYENLTLHECLTSPGQCEGAVLKLGNNTRTGKVHEDSFEIRNGADKITVVGSADGLKTNDYIEMIAVFHKEGYLELRDIYVRKLRMIKIVVSVLPVLLTTWLFARRYKFELSRRMFIEK